MTVETDHCGILQLRRPVRPDNVWDVRCDIQAARRMDVAGDVDDLLMLPDMDLSVGTGKREFCSVSRRVRFLPFWKQVDRMPSVSCGRNNSVPLLWMPA
jgi:hypothetical protein